MTKSRVPQDHMDLSNYSGWGEGIDCRGHTHNNTRNTDFVMLSSVIFCMLGSVANIDASCAVGYRA